MSEFPDITMTETLSRDALELAKRIAHEVWQKYDDEFGYRTEKQERNQAVTTDHPDNIWFFWNQFDGHNQMEFVTKLIAGERTLEQYELRSWIGRVMIQNKMVMADMKKEATE